MSALAAPLAVAVLPVLGFLAALVLLDSYKLVKVHTVLAALAGGVLVAGAAYLLHDRLLGWTGLDLRVFSRWVAPLTEELLKGLVVVALVKSRRVGFLVDAAILGFAIGAGFAVVENAYFVHLASGASMTTWVVRGFGTALMHGGATAAQALLALTVLERRPGAALAAFLPGWLLAAALHSAYNHLGGSTQLATLATLVAVPLVLLAAFQIGERRTADWIGSGFDADVERLAMLDSGHFAESPAGQYLRTLRRTFDGPVVADALCYLRLYTELALRAKGALMLRENGLPVPPIDAETRSRLAELRWLQKSIGATGLRALRPLLPAGMKDLKQIELIGSR
ncbi:MAG TPA: PrsW family glutamic-type intramembrane protease [Burkholderiaceae bacterium]|nr:PrsW family glutamic-type intramembrane protease [Burkholderiaceae bacterium]